ncbi:hypothetical protein NDU88_005980 [Pleurodeles waltl]|uniref:Uncharacterized protein n=1 Tax=Pleurodeles waltl TaxID=8319 RepID=A0AAV7UJK8_PLEWA|nr:hypothetical protein NDU88_005980 [Pleurodeles waltl]
MGRLLGRASGARVVELLKIHGPYGEDSHLQHGTSRLPPPRKHRTPHGVLSPNGYANITVLHLIEVVSEKGVALSHVWSCAGPTIGEPAQQYPGSIIGCGVGDPDEHLLTANQVTTAAKGGVFKPTSLLTRMRINLSSDISGRRLTRRNGAEEKMPEQGKNRRGLPDNLSDALVEEQETARQTDLPRSGESVALPGTVL